jgi:hypothetical protein
MKSAPIFAIRKQGFSTTQRTGANLQHSSGVDVSEQTELMLFVRRSLCLTDSDRQQNLTQLPILVGGGDIST